MSTHIFLWCLAAFVGVSLGYNAKDLMPDGRTVGKYISTLGYPEKDYKHLCEKAKELHKLSAKVSGEKFDEHSHAASLPVWDDVFLDEGMIDTLMHDLKKELERKDDHRRPKRAAFALEDQFARLWGKNEFKYSVSDGISKEQKKVIEKAIEEYEDKTCIDFDETDDMDEVDALFTEENVVKDPDSPCRACIGDIKLITFGQVIQLADDNCFSNVGIVIHEIGHFLGLIHEHERSDRIEHIDITESSFNPASVGFSNPSHVPYDFGSIMHYSAGAGMKTKPFSVYDTTIGQEAELSFYDTSTLNKHFCGFCSESTECLHGGYRRNDRCDKDCTCLDGLDGDLCDKAEDATEGSCKPSDETLYADTEEVECLESPHYDSEGYEPGDHCTWLIRNGRIEDKKCRIQFWFDGRFKIQNPTRKTTNCDNWVEVRLDGPVSQGQRFCGDDKNSGTKLDFIDPKSKDGSPSKYGYSTGYQVLVTFRTFIDADEENEGKEEPGFKLCFKRVC